MGEGNAAPGLGADSGSLLSVLPALVLGKGGALELPRALVGDQAARAQLPKARQPLLRSRKRQACSAP